MLSLALRLSLHLFISMVIAAFIVWCPLIENHPPVCTEEWFEDGSHIKVCDEYREGVWGRCTYLYDAETGDLLFWDCNVNG